MGVKAPSVWGNVSQVKSPRELALPIGSLPRHPPGQGQSYPTSLTSANHLEGNGQVYPQC